MNVMEMLGELEQNLVLLSHPDQEFVVGAALSLQSGGTLNQDNLNRVVRIYNETQATQFSGVEKPLSMRRVLSEISSQLARVPEQDRAFVVECSQRFNALSEPDVTRLLRIHSALGF